MNHVRLKVQAARGDAETRRPRRSIEFAGTSMVPDATHSEQRAHSDLRDSDNSIYIELLLYSIVASIYS